MKRLHITERKIPRRDVVGWSFGDGRIEIDPRQSSREYLDTLIHECVHETNPELTERQVCRLASTAAHYLWRAGFRRMMR